MPTKKKTIKKKKTPTSNRNKSQKLDLISLLTLWRIGYVILGLLVLTTNIAPHSTGILGYWIVNKSLRFLFGDGVLLLPFYCFLGYFVCLPKFYKSKSVFIPIVCSYFSLLIVIASSQANFKSIWLSNYPYETGWLIAHITSLYVGLVGSFLTFSISFFLAISLLGYCLNISIMSLALHMMGGLFNFIKHYIQRPKEKKMPLPFQNSRSKIKRSLPKPIKKSRKKDTHDALFNDFDLSEKDLTTQERSPLPNEIISSQEQIIELSPQESKEEEDVVPTQNIAKIQQWTQQKTKPPTPTITHSENTRDYQLPSLDLLIKPTKTGKQPKQSESDLKQHATVIEEALASFNVEAQVVNITAGPSVIRFELQPGHGVKISKITALSKDIALKLAAPDVRIEAPIPGKALVGIEVPNLKPALITMRTVIDQTDFYSNKSPLNCVLGVTINGDPILLDIARMPHLLIAGATGSGKSVCINSIILSILMRSKPDEVKLLMIDPKKVELSLYEGIPHLIAPVVTNPNKAAATLKQWALAEMERRYETFSRVGVKTLDGYNTQAQELIDMQESEPEKAQPLIRKFLNLEDEDEDNTEEQEVAMIDIKKMPYIIVIIDELADLMMVASQDVESTICRLAQMARATGIHLVIATQRPSVNVITGLIKANVPSRVSFFLQSQIDSRTIIDMPGAEKLLGKGDMLYIPVGAFKPQRIQGVFVSEKEVKQIVQFIKSQGAPQYENEIIDIDPLETGDENNDAEQTNDSLYEEAKTIITSSQYASTSYLQRKLRIGYNRAARLMDELEENGVITAYDGEKKSRKVIM